MRLLEEMIQIARHLVMQKSTMPSAFLSLSFAISFALQMLLK